MASPLLCNMLLCVAAFFVGSAMAVLRLMFLGQFEWPPQWKFWLREVDLHKKACGCFRILGLCCLISLSWIFFLKDLFCMETVLCLTLLAFVSTCKMKRSTYFLMRNLGLLYLVSMTGVPLTDVSYKRSHVKRSSSAPFGETRSSSQREVSPRNTEISLPSAPGTSYFVPSQGNATEAWRRGRKAEVHDMYGKDQWEIINTSYFSTYWGRFDCVPGFGKAAEMWRRGRKAEVHDTAGNDLWEVIKKSYFSTYCGEMLAACRLGVCILCVPALGVGICTLKYLAYMMPTKSEGFRCVSEALLLCSMYQGNDTHCIAFLGWLAWTTNCHFSSVVNCRACTWLVVCLAQKDIHIWKLSLLSCLVYFSPLFGKRANATVHLQTDTKKKRPNENSGDANVMQNLLQAGLSESLRHVRQSTLIEVPLQQQRHVNLGESYAFVPDLFLAVLLSTYSVESLRAVLSLERVRDPFCRGASSKSGGNHRSWKAEM